MSLSFFAMPLHAKNESDNNRLKFTQDNFLTDVRIDSLLNQFIENTNNDSCFYEVYIDYGIYNDDNPDYNIITFVCRNIPELPGNLGMTMGINPLFYALCKGKKVYIYSGLELILNGDNEHIIPQKETSYRCIIWTIHISDNAFRISKQGVEPYSGIINNNRTEANEWTYSPRTWKKTDLCNLETTYNKLYIDNRLDSLINVFSEKNAEMQTTVQIHNGTYLDNGNIYRIIDLLDSEYTDKQMTAVCYNINNKKIYLRSGLDIIYKTAIVREFDNNKKSEIIWTIYLSENMIKLNKSNKHNTVNTSPWIDMKKKWIIP